MKETFLNNLISKILLNFSRVYPEIPTTPIKLQN